MEKHGKTGIIHHVTCFIIQFYHICNSSKAHGKTVSYQLFRIYSELFQTIPDSDLLTQERPRCG